MTRDSRVKILTDIEQASNSRILAYVTGNRQGLEAQVGAVQLPLFRRHLKAIGQVPRIAVLIHTNGGDTNVPWPLMNQIREHCEHVTVLVPTSALSAGTLLTLGADDVAMTKFASLSPIDPTVANAFNPQDPTNPAARLPIAVEDVLSFLELAEQAGDPQGRADAFKQLAASISPLALGNVQRSINQIRKLARQMLALTEQDRAEEEDASLVKSLTTEFYSHMHLINRREARRLGLPIADPDPALEGLLEQYYDALVDDLELLTPFDAPGVVRQAQAAQQPLPVEVRYERGYIETSSTCDAYVTEGKISQQQVGPQAMQFPGMQLPQMQQIQQLPQQAVTFEITSDRWNQLA